ncbi:MAG: four helix bundle protein [Anaerolineales bacterium]
MGRDFRKLVAWKLADDLALEVYEATRRFFPKEERFGLTAQLRSAAVAVPANIAEGAGRESLADFRRFLRYAQGSLSEVEYYLHLAHRLGYIDAEALRHLGSHRAEVGRTLAGLLE